MKKLIMVLGLTLLFSFFLIKTDTASANSVSGASLNDCTDLAWGGGYFYGGGVKLFNGDNFTGGDRVMCSPMPDQTNTWFTYYDYSLKDKDPNYSDPYTDIWGDFQLKAESLRVRARGGCQVNVVLYSEYNAPEYSFMARYKVDRTGGQSTITKAFEIPNSLDNKAKSLKISTKCDSI